MGLGKEACLGEILSWPSTSGGGVVRMPDAYGSLCERADSLKAPAALMYLFEEVHRVYCGKEGNKWLPHWAGLCCGQFSCSPMLNQRLKL